MTWEVNLTAPYDVKKVVGELPRLVYSQGPQTSAACSEADTTAAMKSPQCQT
jgi:hypothetical protein